MDIIEIRVAQDTQKIYYAVKCRRCIHVTVVAHSDAASTPGVVGEIGKLGKVQCEQCGMCEVPAY
jgi:hypothetical protein